MEMNRQLRDTLRMETPLEIDVATLQCADGETIVAVPLRLMQANACRPVPISATWMNSTAGSAENDRSPISAPISETAKDTISR